jgi:DNA-binding transcriptional LysR family regulator
MDIRQLESFVKVVENNSFSKAGEQLHLTQPTISSHITALEHDLNINLIVRTTRETYPSEAGKLLYGYAKQILALRDEAAHAMENFARDMKGTITVAASTIPGQYYLPKMIQSFHQLYPDIKFDLRMLDSAEVVEQVVSHNAEVGFTGTPSNSSKCLFREFANDRLVVITPNEPRFRQYLANGFPVRELMNETFISREPGSGTRKETERFLQEMGITPETLRIAAEVRSTESVKQLVSEGMGVAVLSRSACEDYCHFEKVLAFNFSSVSLRRKLYLVKHKTSILSPIAQVFYDYAKTFYKK